MMFTVWDFTVLLFFLCYSFHGGCPAPIASSSTVTATSLAIITSTLPTASTSTTKTSPPSAWTTSLSTSIRTSGTRSSSSSSSSPSSSSTQSSSATPTALSSSFSTDHVSTSTRPISTSSTSSPRTAIRQTTYKVGTYPTSAACAAATEPWKTLTFGLAASSFVCLVIVVILIACLCRSKKSLKRANTTMYPVTSVPGDPATAVMSKNIKGMKVELKNFTHHGEHMEEEFDSPTFSPTPPPPRTIRSNARKDSTDAPEVPSRPKRRDAPPLPPTNANRRESATSIGNKTETNNTRTQSKQKLINGTGNVTSGIVNPAFEVEQPAKIEFHLGQNPSPLTTGLYEHDDDDDVYEKYENNNYENTVKDKQPLGQGVVSMDTGDIELEDMDAYEEPVSSRKAQALSSSQEFLHRQSSVSGLPTVTIQETHGQTKTLPLKVTIEEKQSNADVETIDDLQNYDDIDFFDGLSPNVSEESITPMKLPDIDDYQARRSNDGETNAVDEFADDDLPLYEDEPVVPVYAQQNGSPKAERTSSNGNGGNGDIFNDPLVQDELYQNSSQPGIMYENYDMQNELESFMKTQGDNGDEQQVDVRLSPDLTADEVRQTNVSDKVVDELGETELDPEAPPMPTSAPPPLPNIPPRRDLQKTGSIGENDLDTLVVPNSILASVPFVASGHGSPLKLNADLSTLNFDDVTRRPKRGSTDSAGKSVNSNPRDSYFMFMEDKAVTMTETSEPHILHTSLDRHVLNLPGLMKMGPGGETQLQPTDASSQLTELQAPETDTLAAFPTEQTSELKMNGSIAGVDPFSEIRQSGLAEVTFQPGVDDETSTVTFEDGNIYDVPPPN